ncbi:MAG: hypothetical protein VX871_06950 [Pseudomonadota bacterium]|nr:hypothetical protein [Pseudomonadota bacterium]
MANVRTRVRFWISIALAAIVIPIVVSVVGEFFIEWAREEGWYEKPSERIEGAMSALSAFVFQAWFLLIGAFVCGLSAGLWLDVLLRKKEQVATISLPSGIMLAEEDPAETREQALRELDDLFAEGVGHRNSLRSHPIPNFQDAPARALLGDWNERVLKQLDLANVRVAAKSRFRTLNLFTPMFLDIRGKGPEQKQVESIWNEKLRLLRDIIDSLG